MERQKDNAGTGLHVRYRCVAGHEIAAEELETVTEVVRLDRGAEIRICAEHGAPVALQRD